MHKAFPWIFFSAMTVAGCREYVRVPSVCTNDPACVLPTENGDAKISRDPHRLQAFKKRNIESTVVVQTSFYGKDGLQHKTATGALIGTKGFVLTTHSAVANAEFITATYRLVTPEETVTTYRETPLELTLFSRTHNVALLRILKKDQHQAPFPLRHGPVVKGDDLWWFGVSSGARKMKVSTTDITINLNGRGFMLMNGMLGDSDNGAPIVNDCGEFVGILLYNDSGGRGVYALPIETIFEALSLRTTDLY